MRSYSPSEDRKQVIEFMPLTLIVGSNGTGKTTIIESLRFIIAGSEPPYSDSRRNFIHESKDEFKVNSHEYACIELRFKNSNDQLCIAKRVIGRAGMGKTPTTASSYKIGTREWTQVHRQDDWAKIIPTVFGLPNQALLNNVILCHQEENLWCMGDSSSVKQVFDKIFGCEQYKKELKYIDDEIREAKKERASIEAAISSARERVSRRSRIGQVVAESRLELKELVTDIKKTTSEIEILVEREKNLSKTIEEFNERMREVEKLKLKIVELTERDAIYRKSLETFSIKRPAPPASSANKQQPIKKKHAPDPTATDLESIAEDLSDMLALIKNMPESNDLTDLKKLVEKTLKKVEAIKDRFDVKPPEPEPEPIEESENDVEKQVRMYRETTEKNITENLKKLKLIRNHIESVPAQSIDEKKVQEIKSDFEEVQRHLIKARQQEASMKGAKTQLARDLERNEREFSLLKDANYNYSEQMGLLACNKIMMDDLEKLKECFMDSINTFHDQMIVKINDHLGRRWRMIYQGKDIESIELVDEEITRGKDKKSYNYYIAMRKNGKRMKMKEKSSAGQRALAAIILRMTLAELFVHNFAFIALDEPTANLDLANVQALAKSIKIYVKKRTKIGTNVQWIIITHDEQFLRALDEESSPYFYRVRMDPSDKCSEIVKIPCHESGLTTDGETNDD